MKKVVCALFVICLLFLYSFSVAGTTDGKTVLYLDYGNISIGADTVSGYDQNGIPVSAINENGYIITQRYANIPLEKTITVLSGNQSIEILNLNIKLYSEDSCALYVSGTSDATITISGENHLVSGTYRAGLEIALNATATLDGNGVLYAQSEIEAGIGGGSGRSNGTLIINSGTIYATGGIEGYGTGIGGGSLGNGGNITINGGNVVAVGGVYGAGIGGGNMSKGGNITINSGTVTATGGMNAAGIGGGYTGNGQNIVINGGSVKAIPGSNASAIGNGRNCRTAFAGIFNSNGNPVTVQTVSLSGYRAVYQNGIDSAPITADHPDDGNLYFYSDTNANLATVYMNNDTVCYYLYDNDSFTEIQPFGESVERYSDYLIYTCSENIEPASDFTLTQGDEETDLVYNGISVDRFRKLARGDMNLDGVLDGTDAVVAGCVINNMLDDTLLHKLADTNGNGVADSDDFDLLVDYGLIIS